MSVKSITGSNARNLTTAPKKSILSHSDRKKTTLAVPKTSSVPSKKSTVFPSELADSIKVKPLRRKPIGAPVTYKQIEEQFTEKANSIHEGSRGLDIKLVRNILAYAQLLTKYRSDKIDQDIFIVIMYRRFNVFNNWSCTQLFRVLLAQEKRSRKLQYRNADSEGTMTVDTFAKFLCLLLSDEVEPKVNLVYHVYDYNNDGNITKYELNYMLSPVIGRLFNHEGEDQIEDDDFLINEVAKKMEMGKGGIGREQFIYLCRKDDTLLSILGTCLPNVESVETFRALLSDKSVFDIQTKFREERRNMLCTLLMETGFVQSLYPVKLDLN